MKHNSTIKPYKETTCIDCGDDTIRKTISGRCFEYPFHYQKYKEKVYADRKANKDSGETKKPKPIPNVSQKQLERLKEYRQVRDVFMKENPYCQARLDYCQVKSTDCHHKAGKVGKLLLDPTYFLAVCRTCHERIERLPEMAKELGLSVDRLNK